MAILLIGYGNELRGDDGLGPFLAAAVASQRWPGVEALAVPQLVPELAERLTTARQAVFVDARLGPGEPIEMRRVELMTDGGVFTHGGDPRGLLALARALYGHAPEAWLIAVTGEDFALGQSLSPTARRNADTALGCIAELIRSFSEYGGEPCMKSA